MYFTGKRYQASIDKARFVRVDGSCSALGLELAFSQGLGLGVGFKVQVKVNENRKQEHALPYGVYGLRRAPCRRSTNPTI